MGSRGIKYLSKWEAQGLSICLQLSTETLHVLNPFDIKRKLVIESWSIDLKYEKLQHENV